MLLLLGEALKLLSSEFTSFAPNKYLKYRFIAYPSMVGFGYPKIRVTISLLNNLGHYTLGHIIIIYFQGIIGKLITTI